MNDKSETLHFSEYMKRTYRSMAEELENELREFEEMKKVAHLLQKLWLI